MSDVTVKRFDELDGYQASPEAPKQFLYAARGLGVQSWGMNVLRLPASYTNYPEHDHMKDGQEEVYLLLEGNATLEADGQKISLEPKMFVRVGPSVRRKIVVGRAGAVILALGGTPGKAYEAKR
jgi:hypothetical protein